MRTHDLPLIQRIGCRADDLIGLVPLAGQHHYVAVRSVVECVGDRLAPVFQHGERRLRLVHPFENVVQDRIGRFGARIVRGDDHRVGKRRGDPSHARPLGAVAISPAAKHCDHTVFRKAADGGEDIFQSVRRVGVVDEHGVVRVRGQNLAAPTHAMAGFQGPGRLVKRHTQFPRGKQRAQRVVK